MVCSIAAVAEQEDVLTFGRVADRARVALFFFGLGVVAKPLLNVELGHLFLVLNTVGGHGGTCTILVSVGMVASEEAGLPSTPL
jgi:hypothetical protein